MREVTNSEIQSVSGATTTEPGASFGGQLHSFFEITHHFVGFREFYNYIFYIANNGCSNIEDDDYFTQHICQVFCPATTNEAS